MLPTLRAQTQMSNGSGITPSLRYWYGASIADFLAADSSTVLGQLTSNCAFSLMPTQRDAWLLQLDLLRAPLTGLAGGVFLEFNIPRMGRRIDAVLLIGPTVFVIEFKVGEALFDRTAMDQVWDYALDLKNFHEASHDARLFRFSLPQRARIARPCACTRISTTSSARCA